MVEMVEYGYPLVKGWLSGPGQQMGIIFDAANFKPHYAVRYPYAGLIPVGEDGAGKRCTLWFSYRDATTIRQ